MVLVLALALVASRGAAQEEARHRDVERGTVDRQPPLGVAGLAAEAEAGRKALDVTLNARIAQAEKAIAATKSAAMVNVRGIATEAAAAIVERLIGSAPASRDVVAAAVVEALKR